MVKSYYHLQKNDVLGNEILTVDVHPPLHFEHPVVKDKLNNGCLTSCCNKTIYQQHIPTISVTYIKKDVPDTDLPEPPNSNLPDHNWMLDTYSGL